MKLQDPDSPYQRSLQQGFCALSDSETLSMIIGEKTPEKSRVLLLAAGNNIKELAKFSVGDIMKEGLTKLEAQKVCAAMEFGRRKQLAMSAEIVQIKCSRDIFDYLRPKLEDLTYEEFHMVYLNRSNRIIRSEIVSKGGISGTVTDIRIIMKSAIMCQASGIICCHNHPSGNLNPSESDTKITQKIKDSASLMDVQLLDHLIIANGEYYSFADNGLI